MRKIFLSPISLLFCSIFLNSCEEKDNIIKDDNDVTNNNVDNEDDNKDDDSDDANDDSTEPNIDDRKKYNVLFVIVDDLRKELGVYGQSHIHSPNIDKLASRGVVFNRAYCQVAISGPSRASMLSGIRPTGERLRTLDCRVDEECPGAISMPGLFKQNGYTTISYGKVFHTLKDCAADWDELKRFTSGYALPENSGKNPAYEMADVADNFYADGQTAEAAISKMEEFAQNKTSFFMAVGFQKPHLPFLAPKKYWDLYPNVGLPDNYRFLPENCPELALRDWGELRGYDDMPKEGPVTDEVAVKLRQGYFACVSYIDALVGTLMETLSETGLDKNTIVVLVGDHGWNLGEHTLWCKHTTFKTILNAPMIICLPEPKATGKSEALVEFLDIYPTLSDYCDLPQLDQLAGKSLRPVLENVNASFKTAVFSRYNLMECVKTDKYQYTECYSGFTAKYVKARMLYDHTNDIDENKNVAEDNQYDNIVEELSLLLKKNRETTE